MSELSRKERELIQRKKFIMDVALSLISEKGYHQTSMNEIAQKAEFSVGTLYNFFINKEELYKAMVNEKASEFYEILKDVLDSPGSPEEILKRWVDTKIRLYTENRQFFSIFFVESMKINISLRAALTGEIRQLHQDIRKRLAGIFEKGIKEKIFTYFDPWLLALSLDGMVNSILVSIVEHPDSMEITTDLILDIFYSRIKTR
ncbi:TetR/AcrR family transcriptional regulator [Desulforegula conservatrix]|uniref:TetR/AcrR family transcriptional regulator n=1 Tax=Desulforegula conservatrix TaxID=153026 RepID=UPI00040CBFDC|nr:TetR/AcrR family transcriptional regulator [Desulforegula conservatrix]